MVQIMQIYKNIGKIGENKMKYDDLLGRLEEVI